MQQPIRFVTFLAPNLYPVYQFIADYVGSKLGIPTELLTGDTHDQFTALRPDVSFICGLPYVLMMRQSPPPVELLAAPVLQGERYQDRPIYFSDVIVHRESTVKSFSGLRGHSWAFNECVSQSGYGITRHALLQMGETHGFFSQVVDAGWHQKAIQMVRDQVVDAAAIDSQVLAAELRDHPALAQEIRLIDALGPSTIQPVVIRPEMPAALKAEIRALLLSIGDDPAARPTLDRGFIQRFAPVQDDDYDDIRAMLVRAEAANFLTIS